MHNSLSVILTLIDKSFAWWKSPYTVSSPEEFEHRKHEIVSLSNPEKDGSINISTPVYSFFGRSGYLPYFISDEYGRNPVINGFLGVIHKQTINLWRQIHTINKNQFQNCGIDKSGLIKTLKNWYEKTFNKTLEIKIIQNYPIGQKSLRYCGNSGIGESISTKFRYGLVIIINDRKARNQIDNIASKYCGHHAKVIVRISSQFVLGIRYLGEFNI